jgi:putative holliday junction resolvase
MRYLGIDYGTKRTGVAISDSEGKVAVVKETIEAEGLNKVIDRIKEIVTQDGVDSVVVGIPLNMNGEPTQMTERVQRFIANLRDHIEVPVQTIDERLTTEMANTLLRGVKAEERDQVAAQILLQNFMDELEHHQ